VNRPTAQGMLPLAISPSDWFRRLPPWPFAHVVVWG
jgi:hypothetical protein